VFGLSFGELCVLVIVAIVVIGPKDMPKVLRKAGQLAGRIRRMASDVRSQSGIDEVLRADGLHEDIAEIRRLAQADFLSPVARGPAGIALGAGASVDTAVVREREYPRDGADAYGATPETAILYASTRVASPLAKDSLYVIGDAAATLDVAPPDAATVSEAPT
jgi:sec-independent protein translocase protein TatB